MSSNNYVDKVYLALELTKIAYGGTEGTNADVYNSFEYFLKELTHIDDMDVIEDYKNEIKNLTEQNELLLSENQKLKSSCYSNLKSRIDLLKKYINDNGGNMEPIVKKQLLRFLDTIFD